MDNTQHRRQALGVAGGLTAVAVVGPAALVADEQGAEASAALS